MTLRITPEGRVKLTVPTTISISEALAFLRKKENWVRKHLLRRQTHARTNPPEATDGALVWYLGKSYPLVTVASTRNSVRFDGDTFLFHYADKSAFVDALERFYKRAAERFIPERVAFWSEKMGLVPKAVRCRRYKSRWGCCHADNTLSFNTALMRYEIRLVDYVVIHELAHIRHKHHQPSFWRVVERYEPDWKSLRKRLL